jgi:hypothetical protein
MANREVRIQKIPLDKLIDTLVDLYNQGIDYIDISGVPGEEFDRMAIVFTKDYMTEEGAKNIETFEEKLDLQINQPKLTDEDLNQLI